MATNSGVICSTERSVSGGAPRPRHLLIDGQEVVTSGSIRIAYSSPAYGSADDLLRDADIAVYRAKAGGKARYDIFDAEMHRAAVERLRTENLLRQAVDRGDFELLYHPIVALSDGHVADLEALVTALAVSLGKSLVAEGVENRRQLELVKELGLEHAQGFFFARPLSAADAEPLLVDSPSW